MRQTFIFGGIALVLVIIIGAVAFYFTGSTNEGENGSERGSSLFGSLFPFGAGDREQGVKNGETEQDEQPEDARAVPQLRKVSDKPATGGIFFENDDETLGIRYIERATGHVYETNASSLTTKRISNTTVPGIEEALWLSKNRLVIRFLNDDGDIETFLATLASTTAEQTLGGKFILSWDRAALDPKRENIFSLEEGASGSTLYLTKTNGTGKRAVYSSPIRSWVPFQSNDGLYIQSAPASAAAGFLYRIAGQGLVKTIGGVPGLVSVVSPNGKYVLFSNGGENTLQLFLLDTSNNTVHESPLETIASKCVFVNEGPVVACGVPNFVPEAKYPTDWLMGRVLFSDDIWLVNPITETSELVSIPSDDAGVTIDVMNPIIDKNSSYFGFTNKNDLSFWALRLFGE